MTTVIRACLALAVRLIDTTTGRSLEERDVRLSRDGTLLTPMNKGSGIWVLTGEDRKDFVLHVYARGFDEEDVPISYETLNPKLPMLDVFLMPSEKNRTAGSVLQINGTLSKLTSIEAIAIERPLCGFHEVVERRGVISMSLLPKTAGSKVVLENMRYALASEDGTRYEVFEVKETQTPTQVVLRERLKDEHKTNDKVCRIIYGRAGPKGAFVLKVRDDASHLPYLLRFEAGKHEYFRPIDFRLESGEIDLLAGATKVLKPPADDVQAKSEEEVKKDE